MKIALFCIVFLVVLVLLSLVGQMFRRKNMGDPVTPTPQPQQTEATKEPEKPAQPEAAPKKVRRRRVVIEDDGCCGEHSVCEKEMINRALRSDIEYFDDEELDRFTGVQPDEYTEADLEEFREVLYTMHAREVKDWLKSLELREVALPSALRDEVMLIMRNEQ